MKVKFKLARGGAVLEMSSKDEHTIDEVIKILRDPQVISLSVVKMTPKQYFASLDKREAALGGDGDG